MEENLISILQEEINDNINNFQEILKKEEMETGISKSYESLLKDREQARREIENNGAGKEEAEIDLQKIENEIKQLEAKKEQIRTELNQKLINKKSDMTKAKNLIEQKRKCQKIVETQEQALDSLKRRKEEAVKEIENNGAGKNEAELDLIKIDSEMAEKQKLIDDNKNTIKSIENKIDRFVSKYNIAGIVAQREEKARQEQEKIEKEFKKSKNEILDSYIDELDDFLVKKNINETSENEQEDDVQPKPKHKENKQEDDVQPEPKHEENEQEDDVQPEPEHEENKQEDDAQPEPEHEENEQEDDGQPKPEHGEEEQEDGWQPEPEHEENKPKYKIEIGRTAKITIGDKIYEVSAEEMAKKVMNQNVYDRIEAIIFNTNMEREDQIKLIDLYRNKCIVEQYKNKKIKWHEIKDKNLNPRKFVVDFFDPKKGPFKDYDPTMIVDPEIMEDVDELEIECNADELSKVNVFKRIFKKEMNRSQKADLLVAAKNLANQGIVKIKGEYKMNFAEKMLSRFSKTQRLPEPSDAQVEAAYKYNENRDKENFRDSIKNFKSEMSKEGYKEMKSLAKSEEKKNKESNDERDSEEDEEYLDI